MDALQHNWPVYYETKTICLEAASPEDGKHPKCVVNRQCSMAWEIIRVQKEYIEADDIMSGRTCWLTSE